MVSLVFTFRTGKWHGGTSEPVPFLVLVKSDDVFNSQREFCLTHSKY